MQKLTTTILLSALVAWNVNAQGTWTKKADFGGLPRVEPACFTIGTKAYMGAGASTAVYKDFWEYDPAGNVWTQKADFPGAARSRATAFSIGSLGYVGTGVSSSTTFYNDI